MRDRHHGVLIKTASSEMRVARRWVLVQAGIAEQIHQT
jgi:hypothetical protein